MYWEQILTCLWGAIGGIVLMGIAGVFWGGWLSVCVK
jgi:hypothetical protein